MCSHNLTQVVNTATRNSEILDLVFCNDSDLVHDVDSSPQPGISDHNLVTLTVNYYYRQQVVNHVNTPNIAVTTSQRFQNLNFHEADWIKINEEISEDIRLNGNWQLLSELEPDVALVWFYDKILNICEKHVPKKKESKRKTIG